MSTQETNNKVIYFDLFDTLVHANRGYLDAYFDRETDRLGDNGTLKNAEETIERLGGLYPELLEKYSIESAARDYEKMMRDSICNVRRDILKMLDELKQDGWKLCVVSDAAFVDIAAWDESPLSKYFDNTVFSCDVGYVKPDPRLFDVAKERMGNPRNCVFIGDGGHEELYGAQKADMVTGKAEYINNRRVRELYQYSDFRFQSTDQVFDVIRNIDFEKIREDRQLEKEMLYEITACVEGNPTRHDINELIDWICTHEEKVQRAIDEGEISIGDVAVAVSKKQEFDKIRNQQELTM